MGDHQLRTGEAGHRRPTMRPGTPDLRPAFEAFLERCSDDALFRRFHGGGRGGYLRHELDRWAAADPAYPTVVAVDGDEVRGVANLAVGRDGGADVAVLIEDAWRGRGLGTRLMRAIGRIAAERGVGAVHAEVQLDNRAALRLLHRLAPDVRGSASAGLLDVGIPLDPAA